MSKLFGNLLQTSKELAESKNLQQQAIGVGIQQGVDPLKNYITNIAEEEKKRLDQLKNDQVIAIDYMNTMADSSSLTGEFNATITADAIKVKEELNNIAKDESLSQYEKAARYKSAVDGFNQKVGKYGGDQESIASMNKLLVNGNLSGAVDPSSREYQIIKGMGLGEYKVNFDGSYNVNGVRVTSSELKALALPEKQYDPIKVQGAINKLAQSTKDPMQLKKNIAAATLQYTVSEDAAKEFLIDGLNYTRKELEGKDLTGMSEMINNHMSTKAEEVFYKGLPAAVEVSDGEIMGSNAFQNLKLAGDTGRFEILNGIEYAEGGVVSEVQNSATPGSIDITYIKDGEKFQDTVLFNSGTFLDLGNRLIKKTGATPTESLKAYNAFEKLFNTPVEGSPTPTTTSAPVDDKIAGTLEAGEYPENIMNAPDEPIVYNKKTDGSKGDFERSIYKKYNMNDNDKRNYLEEYGDTFTEKNILKYKFDKTGREKYNTGLANTKNEMTTKVGLLQDYYNNSQEIADANNYKVDEVRKILKKIGKTWTGKRSFTKKDLALVNYIKAGNKFEDLEKDLASTFKDIEI